MIDNSILLTIVIAIIALLVILVFINWTGKRRSSISQKYTIGDIKHSKGIAIGDQAKAQVFENQASLPEPTSRRRFAAQIAQSFSLEEIKELAFELGVNLADLPPDRVIYELVSHLQRHGRLSDLIQLCMEKRPHVDWENSTQATPVIRRSIVDLLISRIRRSPIYSAHDYANPAYHDYPNPNDVRHTSAPLSFRLDVALPEQVHVGHSFELAVAIRLPFSPKLQDEDLDMTKSGDLQVEWPEEAGSVALRVHVGAPECLIHGDDSWAFRLKKGQDSPVHYFQLTPQQAGRIGIVVTVYQEQEWLGSTRLHTLAQEQVAGKVAVNVYSRPLGISRSTLLQVAEALADSFGPDELRTLTFALDVPYDDLPGPRHTDRALDLVTYMVRHGRFPDLIAHCQQERPYIDWYTLAEMTPVGGDAP